MNDPYTGASTAIWRSSMAAGTMDQAPAQVGADGQAEAVEPFGVRAVPAEPGGQVVARAGPLIRATDPGWVLDRQRGGIDLLHRIGRHGCRPGGSQLLDGAPQPPGPAVDLGCRARREGAGESQFPPPMRSSCVPCLRNFAARLVPPARRLGTTGETGRGPDGPGRWAVQVHWAVPFPGTGLVPLWGQGAGHRIGWLTYPGSRRTLNQRKGC